jgi:hypothetical protein
MAMLSDIVTDPLLLASLRAAAVLHMPAAELREQCISFVIGQTGATREQIVAEMDKKGWVL